MRRAVKHDPPFHHDTVMKFGDEKWRATLLRMTLKSSYKSNKRPLTSHNVDRKGVKMEKSIAIYHPAL